MIYLNKYTFLILVIFLTVIFALVIPRSASATHQNFSCFSAGHADSVCASPAEFGSTTFCSSVDILEACVEDFGAFFNTACTDCDALSPGSRCSDITFGCVAAPPPTPTPFPCIETDSGELTTVFGTCTGSNGSFPDECFSSSTVIQYECSGSSCVSVGGTGCPVGSTCSSGACVFTTPTPIPTVGPGTPTPTKTPTPTPSCSGSVFLSLFPSTVAPGGSVTADAGGLTSLCSGKTIFFKQTSCSGSTLGGCATDVSGGCTGPFSAPASSGSIFACIDKNSNSTFSDSGESTSAFLTVTGPAPTLPPGVTPTPACLPIGAGGCGGFGAKCCLPGVCFLAVCVKDPMSKFTITVSGMIATIKDESIAVTKPITRWLWNFNKDGQIDVEHNSAPGTFTFDYRVFGSVCGPKTYTAELTVVSASGTDAVSKDVTVSTKPEDLKGVLQCLDAPGCKCTKIDTAIGPISVAPAAFVSRIMSLLLGISGGIAVLLIILAGYSLMTSRDKPEAIQDARQRLLGAIVGLLFVVLALVILQVIGVDILHIPGFAP